MKYTRTMNDYLALGATMRLLKSVIDMAFDQVGEMFPKESGYFDKLMRASGIIDHLCNWMKACSANRLQSCPMIMCLYSTAE